MITEGKASSICCPDLQCKTPLEYPEIELILERKDLDRYLKFLTENYLRSDPNVRWCPKPGCETPMIGSKDHPMMICPNPKCGFKFCFNCNTEEWHSGVTCKDYQRWKKENAEADTRFDTWANSNTRRCPSCSVRIEKVCTYSFVSWFLLSFTIIFLSSIICLLSSVLLCCVCFRC